MKKFKTLAAVLLTALLITGCSGGEKKESKAEGSVVVGISQFAQHGSLDNCREGFIEGLAESGYVVGKNLTLDVQNANADTSVAGQIADNFVAKKVDMICAIATPSAMAAYNAAEKTDIPVIFTAVSDPAEAQLANADGSPVGNVTGTSDILPVEAQLKMIREFLPEAKTIGILYTTSEVNSESAIAIYKKLAPKYGFELEVSGISTSSDIPLAVDNLLNKVDCLSNLTDNTVVSSLATILDKANAKKIPVFGSEIEQVKRGCVAAEGLDYYALGVSTGKMAGEILKGEKKASEMPFKTFEESALYVNTEAAKQLGLAIPETATKRAKQVFESIEED